jgi:uncharacterized circularly permuted ATP-grasp superfamily protein/uncharacterized alpha-E superfamily protein
MNQQSTSSQTQAQSQLPAPRLFQSYAPPAGVYDEALTTAGQARPEWKVLVDRLDAMGEADLRNRWQQAQTQIERDGVTFNPHENEGQGSRPWMLDAIPMVLAEAEWNQVSARLCQRARVLEAMLKDLLGKQQLLKDKIIPPELLFGHPAWYPSYQNLHQQDQRCLTYCATDIARSGDGKWWATGDRTRSPFGLGYILENRLVTTRMLSSIFRQLPIRRLAGFYASMKEQLRRTAPRFRDNPRIAIWTKGPQSRGYFEDSYLARYLGYTLAEGDDLAVRDGCVQLLTLGGLLPVEVLLRRVDDDDCDSVELDSTSQIGISGLLDVIRAGKVAVANCIGSRLVESPAFLPFLPAVSRHLLGEELQIPTVATWWCGDEKARSYVLANLDSLLVRPAFRTADVEPVVGSTLSAKEKESLIDRINTEPQQFVGQEIVARSTTPVLTDSGPEPWYVGLRTFSVATKDGFETMPGGLARVSADSNSLNFTMTAGERSQDVWILSDTAVEQTTLLESASTLIEPRRSGSELPSRVADNLFWLGRYSERAEQSARLLRTLFLNLESEDTNGPEIAPLLRVLVHQGHVEPDHVITELSATLPEIITTLPKTILDPTTAMSLQSSVSKAVSTAMRVRDRISVEMWRSIDRLNTDVLQVSRSGATQSVDILALLDNTLANLSGFAGLAAEGMTRTLGWRFLDLGRRLERSWQMVSLLKSFLAEHRSEDPDTLEALLTVTDSLMTYRNRYLSTYQIPVVLDLVMSDVTNPRSILFQLLRIQEHLNAMPGNQARAMLTREQHLATSLVSDVELANLYELSELKADGSRPKLMKLLSRLEEELPKLSDAIAGHYLIHAGLPRHFGLTNPK